MEIMISGTTTTTSPRSRGTAYSGAHRHRHHLPNMQPAQVQGVILHPDQDSPFHRGLSQDDPQSARDVHPRLDPPMSRIFPWRIPSLEHCAWICLPRSFGHRHHMKSIVLHGQLVIICQNYQQCRHTLVWRIVLGFASHVLLADITIFINANFFFT